MKRISVRNGIIFYYGNAAGYLDGETAIIDTLFAKEELKTYLAEKESKKVETREGVYDRLSEGNFEKQEVLEDTSRVVKFVRIHQLKGDSNILVRFISLSERKKRGFALPSETEYEVVYQGETDTVDLEYIWDKFQGDGPIGFSGHSLSISDVVELFNISARRFFYVDRTSFVEIPFIGD